MELELCIILFSNKYTLGWDQGRDKKEWSWNCLNFIITVHADTHKRWQWAERKGRKRGTLNNSVKDRTIHIKSQIHKAWWYTKKCYPIPSDPSASWICILLITWKKLFFLWERERAQGRKSNRICLLWLLTVTKVSVMKCVCSMTIH